MGPHPGSTRAIIGLYCGLREAAGLLVFLVFVSADLRFCLNSHILEKLLLCRDSCSMYGIDQRTNTARALASVAPETLFILFMCRPAGPVMAKAFVCCLPRQDLQTLSDEDPDFLKFLFRVES